MKLPNPSFSRSSLVLSAWRSFLDLLPSFTNLQQRSLRKSQRKRKPMSFQKGKSPSQPPTWVACCPWCQSIILETRKNSLQVPAWTPHVHVIPIENPLKIAFKKKHQNHSKFQTRVTWLPGAHEPNSCDV